MIMMALCRLEMPHLPTRKPLIKGVSWTLNLGIPGLLVICLASPSVTFVLSFFGGSPLHERKRSPLPTRGFRGAPSRKNDTCLTPCIAVHGWSLHKYVTPGDSLVHMKLLHLKKHIESDTWTA